MQNTNDLLRDIAHELQTPISSAKGFVDLVQHNGPLTERQQYFTKRALDVLLHMELMVARLSQLAWMGADVPLEPHSVDLRDVVDRAFDVLENQAAQRQVTIEVKYAPRLGKIQGEERRLDQVMINLLSNAIKYNHDGGFVTVTVEGSKREVRVTVRDTGQGIPEEELEHIFQRYYRTQASRQHSIEGQGLGLAIVQAVIEKHGGRIWVESVVGEGASFIFVLPRRPKTDATDVREVTREADSPPAVALTNARGNELANPPTTGEESDAVDDSIQEALQVNLSDHERHDRGAYQL